MSNIFRKKGRSGAGSSEKRSTSRRDIVFDLDEKYGGGGERADATTMAEEFLDASPTVRKSVSGDSFWRRQCACVCMLVIVTILNLFLFSASQSGIARRESRA
jgi:hypothetical protein